MDPVLLFVVAVVVLGVAGALVAARRRREAALAPVPLGPSWTPPEAGTEADVAETPYPEVDDDEQASFIAERTGAPRRTIDEVVNAWHEYLAVIGMARLPATHRYRVYDPYNPPVARRAPDGTPIADPDRVARDVSMRTTIPERDAVAVLTAHQTFLDRVGSNGSPRGQ